MWVIQWSVAFVMAGQPHIEALTAVGIPYADETICLSMIAKWTDMMPNYARGSFDLEYDTPVRVVGKCIPLGGKGA